MPEFLKTYETKRVDGNKGKRPKSTPPAAENFGTATNFREGTIPSHEEAEALFGDGTGNGSISHMHFNDSMMNLNSRDSVGMPSNNGGVRVSGVSFHSTTSGSSLGHVDKFSPRSYDSTLQKVEEHRSAGNLQWDYSDVMRDGDQDGGDADKTLVGADITNDLPPPPATPESMNKTMEFANYSPPPPVSARTKQHTKQIISRLSSLQGNTIPGHNYNQNHNNPESNLEDPMLSRYYNNRSPRPPSPSTHDLIVSPGGSDPYSPTSPDPSSPSGDHDPYFAEGSQQSCSTSSTVTESSVHFGNSSYSGHSTYSSNSSQSRHSSAATSYPPPPLQQPPPPPTTRPALYPRSTSDPQFRPVPSYSRAISSLSAAAEVGGKSNPTRPKYPPPVKPKPQMKPQTRGVAGATSRSLEVVSGRISSAATPSTSQPNPRMKGRTEMVIIAKDGRKMRASFV